MTDQARVANTSPDASGPVSAGAFGDVAIMAVADRATVDAAFQHLTLLLSAGDVEAQSRAWQALLAVAESADTPDIWETATKAAYGIGIARQQSGDDDEAAEWFRRAETFGERSGTDLALVNAASALNQRMRESDPWDDFRTDADRVIDFGTRSNSVQGNELAARAARRAASHPGSQKSGSSKSYRLLAVSRGTRSRSADGFEIVARSLSDLARSRQISLRLYRKGMRKVISLAAGLGTAQGGETAAKVTYSLGQHFQSARKRWRARSANRLVYHIGRACQTPIGLEHAARARYELAADAYELQVRLWRSPSARRDISERGYRDAAETARASRTPEALEVATVAMNALGVSLTESTSLEAGCEAYEQAVHFATDSGTAKALEAGASAAARWAENLVALGLLDEARSVREQGIRLGQESDTHQGLIHARRLEEALERERAEESAAPPLRTGVIVVHGMGQQTRNALMSGVVNQIADWLERNVRVRGQSHVPRVELDLHEDARSFVTVTHGPRQWVFTEAFWAPTVEAPLFNPTAGWAVSRFLQHLARLCTIAFHGSLVPTVIGALAVAGRVLYALLMIPFLAIIFPVVPLVARWITGLLNRLYLLAVQATPNVDDDSGRLQEDIIVRAIDQWRKRAPTLIAILFTLVVALVALVVALLVPLLVWQRLALAAVGIVTFLGIRQLASSLAIDPSSGDTPAAIFRTQGVILSKHGYLQQRVPRLRTSALYRDSLHNVLTAPATAVIEGVKRWLRANDETALLRLIEWDRYRATTRSRLYLGAVLLGLVCFRLLNSVFAVVLYAFGALLLFPLMFALWTLTAFSAVPGIPSMVTFFKSKLDTFLLGSLGDIKVYLEEVTQATKARGELEAALDALQERTDETVIVAHSLGSLVSYETLAIPQNSERASRVRSLVTVGGILPMVWRIRSRRPAIDRPLPRHIRWVNVWSRLDPADSGPIADDRLRVAKPGHRREIDSTDEKETLLSVSSLRDPVPGGFADIVVSNEDDLLRDHTSVLGQPARGHSCSRTGDLG